MVVPGPDAEEVRKLVYRKSIVAPFLDKVEQAATASGDRAADIILAARSQPGYEQACKKFMDLRVIHERVGRSSYKYFSQVQRDLAITVHNLKQYFSRGSPQYQAATAIFNAADRELHDLVKNPPADPDKSSELQRVAVLL